MTRTILLLAPLFVDYVRALSAPPVFSCDLTLAPEQRWVGALDLLAAQSSFEESWQQAFAFHNASLFNGLGADQWASLADALTAFYPDQAAELRGLSGEFLRVYGQVVTFEYLAAWVYFHELAHTDLAVGAAAVRPECTGLLVQDEVGLISIGGKGRSRYFHGRACEPDVLCVPRDVSQAGEVVHGANMDQSPEAVRRLTLKVRFVDRNGVRFQGVDWYWFTTGVTRALAAGLASVQENWRTTSPVPTLGQVMTLIEAGEATPQVFVFRAALLNATAAGRQRTNNNFEALVAALSTVPLAAPFYVVVAGTRPGEGAILTRNETGIDGPDADATQDRAEVAVSASGVAYPRLPASGAGSLVQTNYDWWWVHAWSFVERHLFLFFFRCKPA